MILVCIICIGYIDTHCCTLSQNTTVEVLNLELQCDEGA